MAPARHSSTRALVLVSTGVLLASSTWLSGTAAALGIEAEWSLSPVESVWLTLSVQIGFITGTLLYSLLNVSDVFNPRRVFFASAVAGAAANAAFAQLSGGLASAVVLRAVTGITLAGVYPVGMKLIASWFRDGLGWRLGVMVGALTLGSGTPYLLRYAGGDLPWRVPVTLASGLAVVGGLLVVLAVADGPHLSGRAPFDVGAVRRIFAERRFRLTAFGYFGHMWELYAFWALAGSFLVAALPEPVPVPLILFATFLAGSLGCAAGGWISRRFGERRVALFCLAVSGSMCAASPLAFDLAAAPLIVYLVVWGVFVVADSPQFSALAARTCPPEYTGTALTAQNGIGFAITLASIQLLPILGETVGWRWALAALAPGPALGAVAMIALGRVPGEAGPDTAP